MLGIGAGPAASDDDLSDGSDAGTVTISSTGLAFFEYRRALFLAGLPLPEITALPPPCYTLPPAPAARPAIPHAPGPSSVVGRLEALLSADGGVESADAWDMGVRDVARALHDGRRLSRGLRLGLIIKVLRASWIRDGTWPIDPRTSRALRPPDSPPPSDTPPLAPAAGPADQPGPGPRAAGPRAGQRAPAAERRAGVGALGVDAARPDAHGGPYSSEASGPSVPSAPSGG